MLRHAKTDAKSRRLTTWSAVVLHDPDTKQWLGIYATVAEAETDCPDWKDHGLKIGPCTVFLETDRPRRRQR